MTQGPFYVIARGPDEKREYLCPRFQGTIDLTGNDVWTPDVNQAEHHSTARQASNLLIGEEGEYVLKITNENGELTFKYEVEQ